ncbi:hypothetical protein [Paenibacillus sp. YYML68]|uniref:hypothetical protein n=1 Tax=Paenibacillus sp. YYML68 TaxID=2909250 RepID=UPI00248FC5E0|nr:hypothetical protein [Paenibacillus sp. YYML68]
MKLRLLPVVLSVVISASLLFGGYFAYQSYAMENPFEKAVNGIAGVELVSSKLTSSTADVELKLEEGQSLREVYQHIEERGKQVLGTRGLKVKVVNESSSRLDGWWSTVLFDVAEAMETKQYSDIPKTLHEHAGRESGLSASSEIDEKFVYVTLTDGQYRKYMMLPRTPATMGVWPNE